MPRVAKPKICENCNKEFTNQQNLNRHLKNEICSLIPNEKIKEKQEEKIDTLTKGLRTKIEQNLKQYKEIEKLKEIVKEKEIEISNMSFKIEVLKYILQKK